MNEDIVLRENDWTRSSIVIHPNEIPLMKSSHDYKEIIKMIVKCCRWYPEDRRRKTIMLLRKGLREAKPNYNEPMYMQMKRLTRRREWTNQYMLDSEFRDIWMEV